MGIHESESLRARGRGRGTRIGVLAGMAAAATIVGAVIVGSGPVRPLRIAGALVGLAALPLAFLPFHTLRRHGRTAAGESYMATTAVVDRGVYGIVRHPQYLAYTLFMAAFSLLSQHAVVVGMAIVAVVLLYRTALAEERECSARLGHAYDAYCRRVPRFNAVAGVARRVRDRKDPP